MSFLRKLRPDLKCRLWKFDKGEVKFEIKF
jgi:hypothetical protein